MKVYPYIDKMKTTTRVSYPIVSALSVAQSIFPEGSDWCSVNDSQNAFLLDTFARAKDEISSIPEIESMSSRNHEEINRFLAERGFSIKLNPFGPDDFGVASVLKLILEWVTKAEKVTLCPEENLRSEKSKVYPAIKMSANDVMFAYSKHTNHPIIIIPTKSGDEVCLHLVDEPIEDEQLESFAEKLLSGMTLSNTQYDSIVFPMIDLNYEPDISWLCGMQIHKEREILGYINQALQQTKFKMDEIGAVVESAVAIGMRCLSCARPKPTYIINKPFLAVVRRPSLSKPIFVGYLAEDCWNKPTR